MSDEKETLIFFEKISKKFNSEIVLNEIDLKIFSGEILGLFGKSGSGKSTLIKILLGFYKPNSGYIYYKNSRVYDFSRIIGEIGFVSQENSFYEKLTVEENLKFFAELYKVNKREFESRLIFLLNIVKLSEFKNKLAEKLSGGMKRRLEFAISLIHDPKILILDEPFNGLDIIITDEIWNLINYIKNTGVTIIIITHIFDSKGKNFDRILFLKNGKIISELHPKENSELDLNKYFINTLKG